jgi:ATP-dependent RNA helicase DeaD
MLMFTRTKQSTVELAEKLEARGFSAAALNGDIPQAQRERTVARLRAGDIDIVVATDVAARGLDVERISHVVNYDAPYDGESYVHRIGRTGRAGRSGEAILFIAPREGSLLRSIERATRQKIEPMDLPSVDAVNASRVAKFKVRISETVAKGKAAEFRPILRELETETGMPLIDIAAALASLGQGESPLLLKGAETFRADERSLGEAKPLRGTKPVRGIKPARGMHPVRDAAHGGGNRKFRRRERP